MQINGTKVSVGLYGGFELQCGRMEIFLNKKERADSQKKVELSQRNHIFVLKKSRCLFPF